MFQRLGQSLGGMGNRDEVDVIGHEAVSEQGQAMQLGIMLE
jgi:hypothetical protein